MSEAASPESRLTEGCFGESRITGRCWVPWCIINPHLVGKERSADS